MLRTKKKEGEGGESPPQVARGVKKKIHGVQDSENWSKGEQFKKATAAEVNDLFSGEGNKVSLVSGSSRHQPFSMETPDPAFLLLSCCISLSQWRPPSQLLLLLS